MTAVSSVRMGRSGVPRCRMFFTYYPLIDAADQERLRTCLDRSAAASRRSGTDFAVRPVTVKLSRSSERIATCLFLTKQRY